MSGPSFASLSVIPAEALIDQPVRISVTGLLPNQSVTLHARLVEKNIRMASCGHFSATNEGSLDLTHHPSLSGSYTGNEPVKYGNLEPYRNRTACEDKLLHTSLEDSFKRFIQAIVVCIILIFSLVEKL